MAAQHEYASWFTFLSPRVPVTLKQKEVVISGSHVEYPNIARLIDGFELEIPTQARTIAKPRRADRSMSL
jgi:hypothetical protein